MVNMLASSVVYRGF